MQNKTKILLAIDPGFERLGIAVLRKDIGSEELLYSQCFKTSRGLTHPERLCLIGEEVEKMIKKYSPDSLAIEKLFFNTNQKTAVGVAEARGVIIYMASKWSLKVFEYTPLQVKVAITGYGRSEKRQMMTMVSKLLKIPIGKKSDDEFDAIAVGLTHYGTNYIQK